MTLKQCIGLSAGRREIRSGRWLASNLEGTGRALGDEPVDLRFDEDAEEFGVDFVIADAEFEDVESAIGGDGAFVGAVGGGEGHERDPDAYGALLEIAYQAATDPAILGLSGHILYAGRKVARDERGSTLKGP